MIKKTWGMVCLMLVGALAATGAAAQDGPRFDYSGIYAGFGTAYSVGDSAWRDPAGPASTGVFDISGRSGSAILGYNWRSGQTYYGLALDLTAGEIGGFGYGGCPAGCETALQSYAALRAQIGHRVGDGHLYGFAGVALGRINLTPVGLPRQQHSATGRLAGIGYEHPLEDGWTLRAELQYMDFEDTIYSASGPVRTVGTNRVGMIRIGMTRYF